MSAIRKFFNCTLVLLFALSTSVYSQSESGKQNGNDESAKQRANEVMRKYLEVTGFEAAGIKKNLHIAFDDILYLRDGVAKTSYDEVSISLPSRMRRSSKDNLYTSLTILNENLYRKRYESFGANPQSVNRNDILTEEELKNDRDARFLKWQTFLVFFPIILDATWYTKLEFKHIGIAESADSRADVLEASTPNRKFQLLFDTKSHLLLVWKIISPAQKDKPQETVFYYSDYKKLGDFLIAHTIQQYENGKLDSTKKVTSFKDDSKFIADLFEGK